MLELNLIESSPISLPIILSSSLSTPNILSYFSLSLISLGLQIHALGIAIYCMNRAVRPNVSFLGLENSTVTFPISALHAEG